MALGFYRARNRRELNGLGVIPVVQQEVEFLRETINDLWASKIVKAKVVLQRWLTFDPSGRETIYLAYITKYQSREAFWNVFKPFTSGGIPILGVLESIWQFAFHAPRGSEVKIIGDKLWGKYPGVDWNIPAALPVQRQPVSPGEKTQEEKDLEKKRGSILSNWKMMVGLGVVGVAAAVIATRKKKGA